MGFFLLPCLCLQKTTRGEDTTPMCNKMRQTFGFKCCFCECESLWGFGGFIQEWEGEFELKESEVKYWGGGP